VNGAPILMTEQYPPVLIGLAALARMAFRGADLGPITQLLLDRSAQDPEDAAAFMDLSILELFGGREQSHAALQAQALNLRKLYRHQPVAALSNPLRVLAFVTPGNLMANTPIEFLVENANIILDVLYLSADVPLPDVLPRHDLAFVAVAEADENRALLDHLAKAMRQWPRTVVNPPDRIAQLSRDGAWRFIATVPGASMPLNLRVERGALLNLARGGPISDEFRFPIIARPVGSHAGMGLKKLDDRGAVLPYLAEQPQREFFISPFVDYRSRDGLFRKYRVVLIDGAPYACHMAISSHWMIHYLNADMIDNGKNRDEEARFMRAFDTEFGAAHQSALREIGRRSGLDYLIIDCAETREGKLLVFEVGNAMIVHAMDPEHIFPYKADQMKKLFEAFQRMLRSRAFVEAPAALSA
jgi:hypothetical protein